MTTPSTKSATIQISLARTLYRKLLRQTSLMPDNASLAHLQGRLAGRIVTEKGLLLDGIRSEFRNEDVNDESNRKERLQRAMNGLKLLYTLDMNNLPSLAVPPTTTSTSSYTSSTVPISNRLIVKSSTSISTQQNKSFRSIPQNWLESVQWLPPLSEMEDSEVNPSHIPVFPLSGPVFENTDDSDNGNEGYDSQSRKKSTLPLFTQFSDIPVPGMEIPLRIFEPRYRQMYQDLLSSSSHPASSSSSSSSSSTTLSGARRFIVPFAHPHKAGQFATHGWLYEIVRVQDVADETNGRFQLVCHHIVTRPVKIHSIINPTDFRTKFSYLRAKADIIDDVVEQGNGGNDNNTNNIVRESRTDLQPLEELLRQLQRQAFEDAPSPSSFGTTTTTTIMTESDKVLVDRLLTALGEGSIWPVVHVWVSNMQMQILQLQVQIAATIQLQAQERQGSKREQEKDDDDDGELQSSSSQPQEQVRGVTMTDEMILSAQEPHKVELESMLLEVSTLVPILLQDGSQYAQCQRLCQRIRERYFGGGNDVEPSTTP